MALKENDLNWFRPLWRRAALAIFLAAWLGWELLYTRDQFWSVLVGLALAYVLWNFFYKFPKEEPNNEQIPPPRQTDENDRQDS